MLVLKFGGASVRTPESFSKIAALIEERYQQDNRLVVVVSAMGNMTDQLVRLATQIHPDPPKRELDMLISVGERVSIALLAMALQKRGLQAVSFTGSQSGIVTSCDHFDARITSVHPYRIESALNEGKIAIVAGFQGVSEVKEITTLGRGGSDTTAVALGAALGAKAVEFFKDVDGIYEMDPDAFPLARRLEQMTHGEALQMVLKSKHPVLHPRCLELAEQKGLPLRVLSFESKEGGTWVRSSRSDE
ncbi:MAG: aspartate kinase [Verrucomicrobia bacterium]|nr:aspartate kinase [Verrucomicrobiota bacterium]